MLSQSQQSILNQSLMAIDFELRSDKQATRDKALGKIQHMLINRTDDLLELLSNPNSSSDITWSRLFETAHESIVDASGQLAATQDQRKLSTLKSKVSDKINIIQRIVALSSQDRVIRISLKSILQKVFQCFRHRSMVQYFGDCYMQIVNKHVLNAKADLSEIKHEEWSELLSRCFQIYDHDFFTQKLILLQCITAIIDIGLSYVPLVLDLPKYIPKLSQIANDEHKSNAANEVYCIVYSFCKNLAADYRFAICELTENVLATIIKSFPKVGDDTKVLICKLLHTSLIVHNPQVDGRTYEYAACKSTWNLHIRNMMHLVQNEVARLRNNRLANSVICEHFVLFASKLCSVAFWDQSVWETSTSEQQSKRRKQNEKLEGITDLIEIKPKVFCWRWLAILAQLLNDHPHSLTDGDFQPLLQLLFDFQSTIEFPIQIQTLRRIIQVLLVKVSNFEASQLINKEFCDGVWQKIAQNALRSSATNRLNLLENTKLLQTLITHKQLSAAFIQSVFETYVSSSIPRTNQSIKLIISLFQHTNVDSLDNCERLRSDTLNWLHTTSMAMELKNISSCDVIDTKLKAELSVLCLFSKVDTHFGPQSADCRSDHKANMDVIETKILYRCFKKMIFTQSANEVIGASMHSEPLPQANQIRSIVIESYRIKFEIMLPDVQMTDNPYEDVINVVSSLHLFVAILNELIAYKALDQKSFDASYFTKKIKFKCEQLDLCMIRLATGRYEGKENMEIIEKLLEVLNDSVHPLLAQIIKSNSLNGIVSWLSHIVNERGERNSRCLLLKSYNQLKFDQKIRFKAFSLLCYLTDGINGSDAFEIINEYDFNLQSNGDLCIVLHLIEATAQRPKQLSQADWMLKSLKQLCMLHHKSNPISERIIDSIPIVVEYINAFDSMTDEMVTIIGDFMKKIKRNRYSTQIGVKMLLHMKQIARSYAMYFGTEEFENLFAQMKDFLNYQMYDVQFAAINSLIRIFDKNWIGDGATSLELKLFHRKLFDFLFAEEATNTTTENPDDQARHICIRGQLIAGLISSSYVLRKESWFLLAELSFKHQLNAETIRPIVLALCDHHKMDHDMLVNENISYLIGEWLIRNYQLADFPWYLTTMETQNSFFRANVDAMTICMLRYQPNALGDFATVMGQDAEALMKAVLPHCLAYLTPILAGCSEISDKYKENGTEMSRLLQQHFGDLKEILRKQFLTVTENLLSNLWDSNMFKELFDMEIDYEIESHNVSFVAFTKSLDYLQLISESANKNVHLITDFCANRPLQIYNFLLFKKLQLQNTKYVDEQLIHLFQYCVVVDKVAAFFVSDAARPQSKKTLLINKKASLLRDIVYFIGNILISSDMANKLKLAACRYLRNFGSRILPSCAQIFEPFLNFTVSSLIPLVLQHNDRSLGESSLECIKFFVIEQKDALAAEISLLDNFPQDDEFNELRTIHFEVKYRGRTFSLTEEIDYFLKVDHRKIEGLVALKEHLSLKKNELIEMYNQLQDIHGFSEDCDKSLIHRLVFTLLQFVQGFDVTKAVEAAKCLGELGPSDLSSIVLKPDHQIHTYEFASTFDKATEVLCKAAFNKLNRLLLHHDAKVLKAVSLSLIFLLKSESGKSLVEDFSYLHLFHVPSTQKRKMYNQTSKELDLEKLFIDEQHSTHSDWLKRLTKVLFDLFGDEHLQEVVVLQSSFADAMLPLLIKMVLVSNHDENISSLQRAVLTFFENHYKITQTPTTNAKEQPIYHNTAVIKCMITVAECIRINNLNTMNKIQLDYMHIAKAAQYCEAYFTSIMYAELWALQIEATSQYTLTQIKSEPNLQEIMKKAYISIGDMDAVSSFLDPISSRQTYLQLTNAYDQISLQMDVNLVHSPDTIAEFANHLAKSGLYALANALPHKSAKQFECAWRLGDWNVLNQMGATDANDFQQEFEKQHYIALKCLQTTKDEKGVRDALKAARYAIISFLKHLSLECTNNIYHHLERLTLLQQIDDFCQVQFEKPDQSVPNIFMKWKHQDGIPFSDFKYREPILAQRISIVKSAGVRASRKLNSLFGEQQDVLQTILLNLASECRLEGKTNLAVRYLASLNSVCANDGSKAKMLLEDAQLNWSIGNHLLSEKILSRLSQVSDIESHFTHTVSRRLLGEYKAESYSDSVETLIEKNFKHSLDKLVKLKENRDAFVAKGFNGEFIDKFVADNQVKAYEAIAKYSDREYNQICVHMKSNEFGTKKQTIAKNEQTLAGQGRGSVSVDTKRALCIMTGNVNIDKKEVQSIETEKSKFLLLAITNYLKICYLSDEFNDRTVFRIISLWFANKGNGEVTTVVRSELPKIASYKFMAALPQISARIANGDESFHRLIDDIMVRCATDHPQQTVYQLLALANAYADDPMLHKKTKEARVLGAAKILEQLKKDKKLKEFIVQVERMCSTLITLANVTLIGEKEKEHIPSKDLTAFHALSQLHLVHCPTLTLPISKDGKYENLITVHNWSKKYDLCGGINNPMKISCVCSNGQTYDQLLKGKDDLRQDAVMQQVFTIMNNMLRSNKETRKRKLHIRTYKIIPLSQRSGILEWCANTTTMSDYLTSTNTRKLGAHQRYFPNDLNPQKCRSTISNHRNDLHNDQSYRLQRKSVGEKLTAFKQLCSQFHPVFHNYFFEKFPRPGMWFERRLAYTNSVATTSMIGYILGIGDRHISNILIDQTTAELIHIDFGIAFEQARVLPTPERVPFRLTRDIVAGFGVSGIDGVFRKSCEKTMEVLRHNKSTIITILEVLLYDPLHMWTLTQKEASKRQDVHVWATEEEATGDKKNVMAERALLRLQAKLNGQEEGLLTQQLTTEGQVDMLIQQAMNPLNWCQMFEGWQTQSIRLLIKQKQKFKHQLNAETIRPIVLALCDHHKMDHDMLVNENISYLIGEWLIRNYQLADFPWYLTTMETQNSFFRANVDAMTICMLRYQPNALGDFATVMGQDAEALMKAVLPHCLAYLTPILAGCSEISDKYKENGTEMSRLLQQHFGDLKEILRKQFLTVTENLLSNLWDSNMFKELFDMEIDYEIESHNVSFVAFTKSLDYLQLISESANKNVHLITDFCANRPLQIYNFLLFKKLQLQNTKYVDEQLIHLFQYCVVVDKVAAFFVSDAARPQSKKTLLINKKASLLRDIVYFIGNILISSDMANKLKLAACRYLRNFGSRILPSCAQIFEPFLNFTVSSLIPLVLQHNDRSLGESSLECIKFFVIEQKDALAAEISLLDNFPQDDEFNELRTIHFEVKYRGRTFSLTEEIDYFLKVDHRKIEGLVALKEHLSLKKNELIEMYNQLQDIHGFSEDCDKSLIHRLVFTLLQFVQGFDVTKAVEAAKCLGELGPSDLSSIVLKPDHQIHTYEFASTFDKATEVLCKAAFNKLNRLLLHHDAKVLKAVSLSLIFLLKSESGKSLVEDFSYLHLFHVPSTQKRKMYNQTSKELDLEKLFIDEQHSTHSDWLKRLTKVLFDLFGDEHLQEVVVLQSSFADAMLPLLIKMVLVSNHDENISSLQRAVLTFFENHYKITQTPTTNAKEQPIYHNTAVIKCMITVAECIRINNLNTMNKIQLDYMHIAKAAQYCEAYFTSIMYAELWALQIEATSQYTLTQIKSEPNLQEIMKKAYISIGDMDAVSSFLDPISSRQTYLQLTNAYDQISLQMDVNLVHSPDTIAEFANHLAKSGLYALANALPHKSAKQFECAWRLGDWNVLNQMGATDANDFQQEFEKQHYIALKCLQTTKDEKGVRDALKAARYAIISFLKHLSLECTNNIYHHLERLTLLQQIDDFCQVQFEKPDQSVPNIFMKWKHQDGIPFSDFKYREPILAQRISIVKSAGVRASRKLNSLFGEQQDVLQTILLNLASECRLEGKTNLAVRYLASLNSVCANDGSKAKMLLEDAQLNWSIGNHLLSEKILSRLSQVSDIESHFTHTVSRRLLGEYKAESYSDSVETLIEKNFKHSLDKLVKLKENRDAFVAKGFNGEFIDKFVADNQVKAYEAIAKYSDREYNQICVHMKSNEFGTKKQTIAKNEQTLAGQGRGSVSVDTKRALCIMTGNVNIDKKEVQSIETEKSKFLLLAITNYLKICYLSDEFNDRTVFRIISLWFANKGNGEVTTVVRSELPKIASYKFMAALPQISARIANGDESFHRLIDDIMVRCATDHPQQTVYQLLALANAYADDPMLHKKTKEARVLGAAKILEQLKKDKKLKEFIVQVERMCSTLITLANVTLIGEKEKEHIPSKDLTAFHALSQLHLVHCPTLTLPISKDGKYENLITVHNWSKKYDLCGGINNPMKISCVCSNGQTYDQLLKGKDDLRQDAVMQQVFTIMNNMLRSNKETRKRKLHIRTYKIIPLSQRSGILEWCANTTTMSDYLTSTNTRKLGAHQRYFPNDLNPQKCRSTISNHRNDLHNDQSYRLQRKSVGEKLTAFKQLCSQFHPVFHNYFFEKFPRPGMWFERRLAYTNSVATTSMIGYILGIGDRHISNILIDQTTAELIHIDFGIAFEQARVLPTPERVPFRLTRDIVAGFGVSGIDGVFRKSCEKTMEVLRHNKSTIITILEVLLYDPLHMWTLTQKEASKRQDVHVWATEEEATGDKKNVMAERALLRLQAKLNGQEEGLLTQQLTTEGQVDMLIQQAMNPLNWCQMFEGWQAYV